MAWDWARLGRAGRRDGSLDSGPGFEFELVTEYSDLELELRLDSGWQSGIIGI